MCLVCLKNIKAGIGMHTQTKGKSSNNMQIQGGWSRSCKGLAQ